MSPNKKEKPAILEIPLELQKCMGCGHLHVTNILISLRGRLVIFCQACAKDLKEALQ